MSKTAVPASRREKIWLWISLAMFLVPEILFSTSPALWMSLNGKSFSEINSLLINYRVFWDHPMYSLIIIAIEFIGVFILFILSIKKRKILLAILLCAILAWLFFIFVVGYILTNAKLIM